MTEGTVRLRSVFGGGGFNSCQDFFLIYVFSKIHSRTARMSILSAS